MIARVFFSESTTGTVLEKFQARLIYLDEIYVLRTRLFCRGSGREDAVIRSVHLAKSTREEDRREQSRGRFHSRFAWSRGSRRGRGRDCEPHWRKGHRTLRSRVLV